MKENRQQEIRNNKNTLNYNSPKNEGLANLALEKKSVEEKYSKKKLKIEIPESKPSEQIIKSSQLANSPIYASKGKSYLKKIEGLSPDLIHLVPRANHIDKLYKQVLNICKVN